jgi:hypothetical protein
LHDAASDTRPCDLRRRATEFQGAVRLREPLVRDEDGEECLRGDLEDEAQSTNQEGDEQQ